MNKTPIVSCKNNSVIFNIIFSHHTIGYLICEISDYLLRHCSCYFDGDIYPQVLKIKFKTINDEKNTRLQLERFYKSIRDVKEFFNKELIRKNINFKTDNIDKIKKNIHALYPGVQIINRKLKDIFKTIVEYELRECYGDDKYKNILQLNQNYRMFNSSFSVCEEDYYSEFEFRRKTRYSIFD